MPANWCFLKEIYGFGTVLQQHATEINIFSEQWINIKFFVNGK
jgi:hypothetical protein